MGKIFKGLVAALAMGSALAVTAPAEARGWGGDHGWHGGGWHGGYDGGWHRGWDRGWHGGWDRGWHGGYGWRGYYGPRYVYAYPRWGYYHRRYYYDDDGGDALLAGIAGLAIGAAIASH